MNKNILGNRMYLRAQALVLVSLLIVSGSIVMAPGVLASDNSGNTTLDLGTPYGIYGYLYDDLGPVIPGVTVTVTNARTGVTFTDITDGTGKYAVDIADISGLGCDDEDFIYATTPAPNQGYGSTYVNITLFPIGRQVDITVDITDPVIGATTIDKPYINSQGTFDGIVPPVMVTVDDVTDNSALGVAAWGIRNENQSPNGTMYFTCDITNEIMPATYGWDGSWYFINNVLVTASISPNIGGTDLFVFGEVNGATTPGQIIGNNAPSHYANFDEFGNFGGVYATMGTLELTDDDIVTPIAFDTFRAYAYVEGDGYVATSSLSTFTVNPWVALTIADIPDGRYAVCVSAIDEAQNKAWTNETTGNPVITVDNYAPDADATGPATSDVQAFNVAYTTTNPVAPNGAAPTAIEAVTLFYQRNGGGWNTYGDDLILGDGVLPVDVSGLGGDGTYDWYMIAYDWAANHELALPSVETYCSSTMTR
jgi:hypothetical protein